MYGQENGNNKMNSEMNTEIGTNCEVGPVNRKE